VLRAWTVSTTWVLFLLIPDEQEALHSRRFSPTDPSPIQPTPETNP
jgi:hypothetical protein